MQSSKRRKIRPILKENLLNLRKIGSMYEGHPMPSSCKWVKVASGSLGQGLSVGVGIAQIGRAHV